jgi:hypothetical protein
MRTAARSKPRTSLVLQTRKGRLLKGNENLRVDNIRHKQSILDFTEEIGLFETVFILEVVLIL